MDIPRKPGNRSRELPVARVIGIRKDGNTNSGSEVKLTHQKWFSDPASIYREMALKSTFYHTASTHPEPLTKLLDLCRTVDKNNVLEIGSGPKPLGIGINPKRVTLIDISAELIKNSRDLYDNFRKEIPEGVPEPANVRFLEADARNGVPKEIEHEHFSLLILSEMLTHVLPEERNGFLRLWASKTESFLIVDRHTMNKEILADMPEMMDGHEIRHALNAMGFETKHFSNERYQWNCGEGGKIVPYPYFFLVARRQSLYEFMNNCLKQD